MTAEKILDFVIENLDDPGRTENNRSHFSLELKFMLESFADNAVSDWIKKFMVKGLESAREKERLHILDIIEEASYYDEELNAWICHQLELTQKIKEVNPKVDTVSTK